MPPGNINFTIGATSEALIAELQRIERLVQNAAASVNFQAPFDRGGQAARRMANDFQAANLSLQNMRQTADSANQSFKRQVDQLKQVEAVLREVRNLPIVNQRQFSTLRELEGIAGRLRNNLAAGVLRPETFAQVQLHMARFKAELQGVLTAQTQVAKLGKEIAAIGKLRMEVDPRLVESLRQFQDLILRTGPIAKSTFNDILRGAQASNAQLREAEKLLNSRVVAEQQMGREILRRANAEAQANLQLIKDLTRIEAIAGRVAQLKPAPAQLQPRVQALQQNVAQAQITLPTITDARQRAQIIAELNRELQALGRTVGFVGKSAAEADTAWGKFMGRFGRYLGIVAGFTVVYKAMQAVMASVRFIADVDEAMTRMSTTMENAEVRARLLPQLFMSLRDAMLMTGFGAKEAGEVLFSLQKAIGNNATEIRGALVPALSLVLTGEANLEQATRALVGIYNTYGDTLTGASTAAEKYGRIADILTVVSRNTVASSADLAEAIQLVGGRARLSGVGLDELTVFLGLLQNALQAAGRSGSGLSRTLESLISNSGKIQEAFNINLGPNANPLELMFELLKKLKVEMDTFGKLTPQTMRKIEESFQLEQAGRQLTTLVLQIEKFYPLLAKVRAETGAHKDAVDEYSKSLTASANIMLNQFLFAIDAVIARIAGDEATGQFKNLATLFRNIGAAAEYAATWMINYGREQDKALAKKMGLQEGPLPPGAIKLNNPYEQTAGIEKWLDETFRGIKNKPLDIRINTTPEPGQAAEMDALAKEIELSEALIKKQLEQKANDEDIALAKKALAAAQAEVNREYQRQNPNLEITERIKFAQAEAASELSKYSAEVAKFNKNWNALGKTHEEAAAKVETAGKRAMQAQSAVDRLQQEQKKESIKRWEKEQEEIEKTAEAIRKYQTEIDELSRPKGVFAAAGAKEQADFEDRRARDIKDRGEKVYESSLRDLNERMRNLRITAAYDKIYDGIVKPFRDGTQAAYEEIEELFRRTDEALRVMDLSGGRRRELEDTKDRAIGKLPFINMEQAQKDLRILEAQFGLFGEEARAALYAANAGFSSFNDLVEEANLQLQYTGSDRLAKVVAAFAKLRGLEIGKDLTTAAQALHDAQRQLDIAFTEVGASPEKIAANAKAWDLYKMSIDQMAASTDLAKQQMANFLLEVAKVDTTTRFIKSATEEIRNIERAALGAAEGAQLFGADAIAAGIAAETWGLKLNELDARTRNLVKSLAEARQKQKELADVTALEGIGASPEQAKAMAAQLAFIEERNKKYADGAAVLERYNKSTEASFQSQLELAKQSARATGDFVKFFELSMVQAGTQGHDFWTDFETMAKNTVSAATTALSDGFFAVLTGNLNDAKAAFKNFFNAILRELSNFMASQLVRQFLGAFAGGGGLGTRGGSGTLSDQIRGGSSPGIADPLGEGMITSGSTIGGGVDWSGAANSVGAFVSGLQIATAKTSLFGATLEGISIGWKVGEGLSGGIMGAAQGGWQAFSNAMVAAEGLSVALAGVGAAVAAFGSIMDIAGDNVEAGIGGLVGGTIGAVALGYFFPVIGHFIGYIVGDLLGSLIGGLFGGGPSNYEKKRQEAAEEANEAFNTLSQTYKDAAKSGDPNTVLGALRTGGGGAAGNSVRTNLTLSPELAARLGITGDIVGERVIAQWANITPEQFARLLAAYTADRSLIESTIAGSGDVPYLEGEDAEGVADAARQIGINLLKAFVAFAEVRKKVDELSDALIESSKDYLSPATAAAFAENIVAPIREQILAATTSGLGVEEMTTKLKGLQATLQAYVSLVGLYSQLTAQHAGLSGDYAKVLELEAKTVATARKALDKQIESSVKGLGVEGGVVDQIFAGGTIDFSVLQEEITKALANLTPELAFDKLKALNDAVLARYDFEKNLILGIEAEIAKLYEGFFDSIMRLGLLLGKIQVDVDGTSTYFEDFIRVLGTIATTTLSVSEAIYLATATLDAAIAALPARISGQGGLTGTTPGPGAGGLGLNEIFPAVLEGLDPFIRTINTQIEGALAAGDYEAVLRLQEELANGIVRAYDAAIAGVRQWEQEQLDAIEETRRAAVEAYEAARDAELELLDAQADVIQAQLDGIDAQKFAIQQQQWVIEDAIYAAEQALKPLEDSLEAIEDQQKAIERNLIRPLERQIRGLERLMDPIQDQLDGYQDQIDAINEAQDDQLWNIRLQQRELEDQRDVIQDQIDLIEEWSETVRELAKFIEDLALGDLAPPDLFGQFNIAQTKLADLFAEFFENPDAENVGDITSMVDTVLGLAAQLFGQSSTEYQDFFDHIMEQLRLVQDIAEGEGGDPTELADLEDQLEHVNEQLETLADLTDDIQWANEQQIHAIEELMDPLEDALDEYQRQIDLLQEQIDLHQEAVEDLEEIAEGIQDQLEDGRDAIEVLRDQAAVLSRAEQILGRQETILNRDLSGIRKAQEEVRDKFQKLINDANENAKILTRQVGEAAQAQINWIQDNMRPIIAQAQISQTDFYAWMRNNMFERLMDYTEGRGSAAWMKRATQDTQAFTGAIMTALDKFLSGELVPAVRITESGGGNTEERLIGTLNSLDITLGNLDQSIQALNGRLGTGVPYTDPYGGAPPPSAAIGARYVHDGVYRLHEGEMVVPKAPAEALRSMSTGWHDISASDNNVNVNIGSVVIQAAPGDNGDALYGRFISRLESDIRSGGRMRSVIQRAVN